MQNWFYFLVFCLVLISIWFSVHYTVYVLFCSMIFFSWENVFKLTVAGEIHEITLVRKHFWWRRRNSLSIFHHIGEKYSKWSLTFTWVSVPLTLHAHFAERVLLQYLPSRDFFIYTMPHICHGARAPVCPDGQIMQLLKLLVQPIHVQGTRRACAEKLSTRPSLYMPSPQITRALVVQVLSVSENWRPKMQLPYYLTSQSKCSSRVRHIQRNQSLGRALWLVSL